MNIAGVIESLIAVILGLEIDLNLLRINFVAHKSIFL